MRSLSGGPCQKMAKRLLSGLEMRFSKRRDAVYGFDDMYRILLAACVGDGRAPSIDGQCRRARQGGGRRAPSRSWVLGRINGVRRDHMLSRCRTVLRRSVLHARRRGMLRGAVDVSIDMHDMPFYAKCMGLFYAVKSREKDGTRTFNRLATIHCVTAGQRLTLGAEVAGRGDGTADVVGGLLDWCTRHGIAVASLTMDRGFHSVAVLNAVRNRGIPMVMPAVKNKRINAVIRRHDSGAEKSVLEHSITSHDKESASYTLIILRRSERDAPAGREAGALDALYKKKEDGNSEDEVTRKYYVFATTMDGEWMRGDPYAIAEFYRRRWGIENSYKCFERIRPRTTSTKYPVRILWWYLPFLLYNAWIMGCFMAARMAGVQGGRPPCTLGDFLTYMRDAAAAADPGTGRTGRPPD